MIYTYKGDLELNNPQWLLCHKTETNQISLLYLFICHPISWIWNILIVSPVEE